MFLDSRIRQQLETQKMHKTKVLTKWGENLSTTAPPEDLFDPKSCLSGFQLLIQHHRINSTVKSYFFQLGFILCDHSKSLLPSFDRITQLCCLHGCGGGGAKSLGPFL